MALGSRATHRGLLVAGLFFLCLVPRAIMAWKLTAVCPDGVFYIRLADAIDRQRFHEAFRVMHFNLYPVILMLLERGGMPWEVAGKWWGVLLSSATVLPLYGWMRRMLNERVALAGGLLYAFHADLIRWSPEVIRDPSFWCFFAAALYFSWRAAAEARWWLFLAAGFALALAELTRIEGFVLWLPLAAWTLWHGRFERQRRWRLFAGAVLAAAVYPLLLVLISDYWIRGYSALELVRREPLELAGQWAQAALLRRKIELPPNLPLPLSLPRMIEMFVSGLVKGLTPLFALFVVVGFAVRPRLWRRREHLVLLSTSAAVCLAVWVNLWWTHLTCKRYFFPVVMLLCPLAASGLLRCSAVAAGFARRCRPGAFWKGKSNVPLSRPTLATGRERVGVRAALSLAGLLPLVLVIVLNLAIALGTDCRFRTATLELGRWAQREFGPVPLFYGPNGATQVVGYYAHGVCGSFPPGTPDADVLLQVGKLQPDVVLLPAEPKTADHGAAVFKGVESLGFVAVDRSQFSGGCRKLLVLARRSPLPSSASSPASYSFGQQPQRFTAEGAE
ncbi:MAG: glycosyltransferase family 39 protein [Thermoguttaceae bacterium]